MAGFFDFLFGGEDTSGQDLTIQQRQQALPLVQGATQQGRQDLLGLAPQQIAAQTGGVQSALDLLAGTIPQQFNTFQQGNVGAQSALLSGLGQQQAAILGLPINNAALQPQTLGFDTSFASQQLPQSITNPALLSLLQAPPPEQQTQTSLDPLDVPFQAPDPTTGATTQREQFVALGLMLPPPEVNPLNTATTEDRLSSLGLTAPTIQQRTANPINDLSEVDRLAALGLGGFGAGRGGN